MHRATTFLTLNRSRPTITLRGVPSTRLLQTLTLRLLDRLTIVFVGWRHPAALVLVSDRLGAEEVDVVAALEDGGAVIGLDCLYRRLIFLIL